MKRSIQVFVVILVCMSFLLGSCSESSTGRTEMRIAVLNGTTGFGIAKLMKDTADFPTNYQFSIETDASVITANLIAGTIDIAALPTNAASVLYNKTEGKIKLLALNTLGVLYVAESGNMIKDFSGLDGKTVFCPAQNPALIFKYLCGKSGINVSIDTTYAQPAALMSAFAASNEDMIAVLPEPILSVAMSKNSSIHVISDLTEEWKQQVGEKSLVQGCVVVRSEFLEKYPSEVKKFLGEYEKSVKYINDNVSEMAQAVVDLGIYSGAPSIAEQAIPKCNIVYIDGTEMKSLMHAFLCAMNDLDPASIGGKIPEDDFYYLAD